MQPLNEIKHIDITKIMISLRRAKPEWFSPSDFRQVIFAEWFSPMVMKSYEPYIK